MKTEHMNWLKGNRACTRSIEWIAENNIQSLEEAWYTCARGDWMLWMAQTLGVDKKKLMMCGALCAHTVVQFMQDPRSRNAVRVAFLWGRGKATDAQLKAAKDAATYGGDWADYTARAAVRSADWTAYAAEAAACAADAAALAADWAADARKANQMRTASIAMELLTEEVMYILSNL